jgi:hypothetical protein
VAETEWTPTPADLASFMGDWFSEEAGAKFTVAVEGDKAFIKQRPATPRSSACTFDRSFVEWVSRE